MEGEAEAKTSSSQLLKRTNDRRVLCILYLSTMAATCIAVSVQAMDETENGLTSTVQNMLLGTLYASSSLLLFGITIYFFALRKQTFEVARKSSEEVNFMVKYSSHGESINLYLRIGLLTFALMGVGQSGVRISQFVTQATTRWPEIYKTGFELLLFVCQTAFILVYHRIVILDSQELFGASFIHILGTNLCMWADVTVEKIQSTLHLTGSLSPNNSRHDTLPVSSYSVEGGGSSVSAHISFYLLPAVSEYSLLSAALLFEIIKRIGEPSYIELKEAKERKKWSIKAMAKHSAALIRSGYWAPLVIISVIVVLTIVTGATPKSATSYWKCAVLFTEEMILYCMGIFVTLAAFLKLRHLKFTIPLRPKNIDEFQLYIAFTFTVIYLTATVALASYLLRDLDYPHKIQDLLMGRVALDVLELLEAVLQTYLIQDCFRRCSEEESQRNSKPGRQMIAILIGINLACWVVKSFQLKEADILYAITDNAPYAWVLLAIAMPIYLFYRYHCTVCLSEAFIVVYEDETSRFESLWRQHPVYLARLMSHPNMASAPNRSLDMEEMVDELTAPSSNHPAQRRFSFASWRRRREFGRHASFFHPQAMNLRQFSSQSFVASQMDAPEPFSETGVYETGPTRPRLPHSESHEGPNYFLHRERRTQNHAPHHDNPVPYSSADGQASMQTDLAAYETAQPTEASRHFTQHKLFHSHLPQSATSQVNQVEESSEGIPRRPTLANLQAAKDRVQAREKAHKRVLESASGDYPATSSNTQLKPSHRAKGWTATSQKATREGGDAARPKQVRPKSTVETPESHLTPSDPPATVGYEHTPPTWSTGGDMTASDVPTRPITPLRQLEPSLVLHRVMASNLSQRRTGALTVDVQDASGRPATREKEVRGPSSPETNSSSPLPPSNSL